MATVALHPLISALNGRKQVEIKNNGTDCEVKPLGLRKRLFSSAKEQKERSAKIALALSEHLARLPRMEIPEAAKHPALIAARSFLKGTKKCDQKDQRIKECWKQLVAARLGIKASLIEDDFLSFARQSHLDRYLLVYNHALEPNGEGFKIMCDGKKIDWKDAVAFVRSSPKQRRKPSQPWLYGLNGVQNEDMYEWNILRPFKHDDPKKWGSGYTFEYVVCSTGDVRLQGDHAWFRLKTPQGEIYSVGLYRPGKRGSGDNFKFPFRTKPGYLMQPDVSEFWPDPTHSVEVKITKEQFETIKKKVEQDKKENMLIYQMLGENCSQYVNNIAGIAGISFPTKMHVFRYIMPGPILKVSDKIAKVLPKVVKKALTIIFTPFLNLLLFALGAGALDKNLKKRKIKVRPHIRSFSDLFKTSKHYFHPPLYFFNNVIARIKQWRGAKIEKLRQRKDLTGEKLEDKIKKISFSVPKQYRMVG